jgi:thymidylate synthase
MKTKILNAALMSGLVVFGLVSCAQPNNSKVDNSDLGIKNERTEGEIMDTEAMKASADSLVDYENYASVIEARYLQNEETLKEMKKNLKSEVNAVQLEYDQELKELNDKNLELKTNVMDNSNLDQESWDNFKTSTNNKMDELEKFIKALAEKVS